MRLDTSAWEWFQLGGEDGLFDIRKGQRLTSEDQAEGKTPYIGAIDSNNGVSNRIGQKPIHEGNTISLSYNGSVGEAFYQPVPYWATDDVNALYLRPEYGTLCPATGLFVCSILRHEKYRYSYGRKWTLDNMNATKIKLPATAEGHPDWKWMKSYVNSLHSRPLTTQNHTHPSPFDTGTWKTFGFTEIFKVGKGFYNKKPEPSGEGKIPFLSATSENNGVTEYYALDEIASATRTGAGSNEPLSRKLFPGHAVCVTNNGSVGFAYYQPEQFTCSHDVNPLYRLDGEFNEATGLFVSTVIMKDRYRWAYGRKWRPERMVNSTVNLPATVEGKPDWQWMESYIKSLPYGDRI